LMGGCSTPISALAHVENNKIYLQANIVSPDGKQKVAIEKWAELTEVELGIIAGKEILQNGAQPIIESIRKTGITNGNA
jgi:hydroxymethylbilane synthase